MNKYTDEQIGWLRTNSQDIAWDKVTTNFNNEFGMECTISQVTYLAKYHGIKNGRGNGIETKHSNGFLGSGYLYVKKDGKNIYKARVEYEKHFGAIPNGYVVVFKDKNRFNFEKDNLVAVSRKDHFCLARTKNCSSIKATIENFEQRLFIARIDSRAYYLEQKLKQSRKGGNNEIKRKNNETE